ncbi:MAG: ABC transporter ATP-binding protein [Bdellovibrionaceae bacterium]|nr:ABC transporter ATP-binding protein [Pseudobdellovibrionaceae bacterium]
MSSSEFAIRVSEISKYYEIYDTPRARLKQFILPHLKKIFGQVSKKYFREFWALRSVTFDIKKGDTVGIIGRNGSGKSTLLQILCGTLFPTHGEIQVCGRVAALLELGSGFNPEFTGRDNVYMNAALLGLTKTEIDNRFDKIVSFADIGEHIDQPVKTYSSGMYVRLAFAVIAHVDADILIVDEALSVGDAVFNQKCMRFIRDFQTRGTLLFVSHDLAAVQNLCKTSLWLSHGEIKKIGDSKDVATAYLQSTLQDSYGDDVQLESNFGHDNEIPDTLASSQSTSSEMLLVQDIIEVRDNLVGASGWKSDGAEITSVTLVGADNPAKKIFEGGEKVQVRIGAKANMNLPKPILGFIFKDRLGQDLFGENTLHFTANNPIDVKSGENFCAYFTFTMPLLPNGNYAVMVSVANGDLYENVQYHLLQDALIVNILSNKVRWGLVGIPFDEVKIEVHNE